MIGTGFAIVALGLLILVAAVAHGDPDNRDDLLLAFVGVAVILLGFFIMGPQP